VCGSLAVGSGGGRNLAAGPDPLPLHQESRCGACRRDAVGGESSVPIERSVGCRLSVPYKGQTMYGVNDCERLATEQPDLAESNADNDAFYGLSLITAV